MSQENVEIVVAMQIPDLIRWLRDDAAWTTWTESLHPDFKHVSINRVESPITHDDAETVRRAWLKWVTPWQTYRQEIDEALDCGDQVLLMVTHFARAAGSDFDVQMKGASLWTVREGKVLRMESYTDRAEALKAVGLEE